MLIFALLINSALQLAGDVSHRPESGPDTHSEDIIDFMSPAPFSEVAIEEKEKADVAEEDGREGSRRGGIRSASDRTDVMASLRHARLRQQTVSLILQDDPGELIFVLNEQSHSLIPPPLILFSYRQCLSARPVGAADG